MYVLIYSLTAQIYYRIVGFRDALTEENTNNK